jgi:molybdopterin converting factor small subunit
MTVIRLPTPLRPFAEGRVEVNVEGASVGAALQDLTRQHPGLRPHLYTEGGGLRAYVNVFRNEDDVRTLQGEATPLREDDRLLIVPSIAGGTETGTGAVDYSALPTNQALIISLLILGFMTEPGGGGLAT